MLPRPSPTWISGVVLHSTSRDAMIFENACAEPVRGARQAADQLSGIERAAGNLVHHAQRAGILPANGECAGPRCRRCARFPTRRRARVAVRLASFFRIFSSPARTSPKPGRSPAAVSARAMPPVRPLAPAPMRPASRTTTDFSGASRRSHAAAARPVKPRADDGEVRSSGKRRGSEGENRLSREEFPRCSWFIVEVAS